MANKNLWKDAETLAQSMHQERCEECKKTNGILETCPKAEHWISYAKERMERRARASVGRFGFGKPRAVTLLERRMKMGTMAKEVKDCLE